MSMKATKHDRRSTRTRYMIERALVDLLRERQFDEITIQDILDRANVGRSTFYAHFMGKDDVLLSSLEHMLEALEHETLDQRPAEPSVEHLFPSLELLHHVREFERHYQALAWVRHPDLIPRTLQLQLTRRIERNLTALAARQSSPPTVPLPMLADFVAMTFLNLMRGWMESRNRQSPEEVDAMFRQLALPGVCSALGIPQE